MSDNLQSAQKAIKTEDVIWLPRTNKQSLGKILFLDKTTRRVDYPYITITHLVLSISMHQVHFHYKLDTSCPWVSLFLFLFEPATRSIGRPRERLSVSQSQQGMMHNERMYDMRKQCSSEHMFDDCTVN